MYSPRLYLALFVIYLSFSAIIIGSILLGNSVGNGVGVIHFVTTIVYSGYVMMYRRRRVAEGQPTRGLALFR